MSYYQLLVFLLVVRSDAEVCGSVLGNRYLLNPTAVSKLMTWCSSLFRKTLERRSKVRMKIIVNILGMSKGLPCDELLRRLDWLGAVVEEFDGCSEVGFQKMYVE